MHPHDTPNGSTSGSSQAKLMRAAIYARVSTGQQERDEPIKSQLEALQVRIAYDGAPLVREPYVDEGYPGALLARPALDRLLDDAADKVFDVVYIADRDRLSRPDHPGEGYYLRN